MGILSSCRCSLITWSYIFPILDAVLPSPDPSCDFFSLAPEVTWLYVNWKCIVSVVLTHIGFRNDFSHLTRGDQFPLLWVWVQRFTTQGRAGCMSLFYSFNIVSFMLQQLHPVDVILILCGPSGSFWNPSLVYKDSPSGGTSIPTWLLLKQVQRCSRFAHLSFLGLWPVQVFLPWPLEAVGLLHQIWMFFWQAY